jgi:hypothetical protein
MENRMTDTPRLVYFALRRSAAKPDVVFLAVTDDDGDTDSYALTPGDLADLKSEIDNLERSPTYV